DDLESPDPDRHQPEADVVDRAPGRARDVRRILDEGAYHQRRQDADREVDVEDPAPRVVVGDPAPERWPDDRRDDHADPVDTHRDAPLPRREALEQHRLRDRLEGTSADALDDARHDQHAEALGRTAEDRGRGEDADTHEQEPRAAEESAEPAAGR